MLKLIGMLLRLYHPSITCKACGYVGVADMRYRSLLPWLGIMLLAACLYVAMATVFVWAAGYFALNWPVGIFFSLVAAHFIFLHTPDLGCPECDRVS